MELPFCVCTAVGLTVNYLTYNTKNSMVQIVHLLGVIEKVIFNLSENTDSYSVALKHNNVICKCV